ncbi:MAG: hypothetical protein ACLFQB_10860 [Chitinispirillaceae bacterium]
MGNGKDLLGFGSDGGIYSHKRDEICRSPDMGTSGNVLDTVFLWYVSDQYRSYGIGNRSYFEPFVMNQLSVPEVSSQNTPPGQEANHAVAVEPSSSEQGRGNDFLK